MIHASRLSQLRAVLRDLRLFKRRCRATIDRQIPTILDRIARKAKRRRHELRTPSTADQEFAGIIEREVQNRREGGQAYLGAQLGRARTLLDHEDLLEEAGSIYQNLLSKYQIPESHLGLRNVVKRLLTAGDRVIRLGHRPDLAINRWEAAKRLGCHLREGGPMMADLRVRQAYGLHSKGDATGRADEEFRAALACFRADPGGELARTCRALLAGARDYWSLDERWERMARTAGPDDASALNLPRARAELKAFLADHFDMDQPSFSSLPIFCPISVAIAKEVLPPEAGKDWWFVSQAMEEMRQRILRDTGVSIPGVRVRGDNDYPVKGYVIAINELPAAFGIIEKGKCFVRAGAEYLGAHGISASEVASFAPRDSGLLGFWTDASIMARVRENGTPVTGDPFEAALAHLDAVLRRNLAAFLGPDEIKILLHQWTEQDPNNAVLAELCADADKSARLGRVLRALVGEGVPISDWQPITGLFAQVQTINQNTAETVALLRLRLKAKLPGQGPEYRRVVLPAHVEASISKYLMTSSDGPILIVSHDTFQEISAQIRQELGASGKTALIVDRADLRAALYKLVCSEFPQTTVLSKAEIEPDNHFRFANSS